jgi:hypothetical protein
MGHDIYAFNDPFGENLTEGEKIARDILWRTEHDAAYERANLEARLQFNRCVRCGKNVCEDCYLIFDEDGNGADVCKNCYESNKSQNMEEKR